MKRAMIFGLAVLCALALASTGQATWITADGTMEFHSLGFEYDTVGTNPAAANPGSWYVRETNGNVEVYGPASGGPGADFGDNYLSVSRPASGNASDPNALALMANAAAPGALVVAEQSLYFDSSSTTAQEFQVSFVKGTGDPWADRHSWMTFNAAGTGNPLPIWYCNFDISGVWHHVTTGGADMYAPPDTWTDVRLDLTVGQSYTVTVDGVTSDPIPIEGVYANDSVIGLQYCLTNGGKPGTFYVDGVIPEPGSVVMLLSGACLALLIWRRRSR